MRNGLQVRLHISSSNIIPVYKQQLPCTALTSLLSIFIACLNFAVAGHTKNRLICLQQLWKIRVLRDKHQSSSSSSCSSRSFVLTLSTKRETCFEHKAQLFAFELLAIWCIFRLTKKGDVCVRVHRSQYLETVVSLLQLRRLYLRSGLWSDNLPRNEVYSLFFPSRCVYRRKLFL